MKKFIFAILTMMVLVSTASAFNSNVLKRYVSVTVNDPKSIVNPSYIVNERTSFKLHKFDISSVTFEKMLHMAGNKTLCQDPLDNAVKNTENISKRISAARAKLEEYKIPNIKTNK